MKKIYWIIVVSLIFGIFIITGCDKIGGASFFVSKNMEILAKALFVVQNPGGPFGDSKYIFEKVEVVETGKDLGHGRPVKFRLMGIHGYKTVPGPPPNFRGFAWVADPIENEEKFDKTIIVFYTKDEFGKLKACMEGGFICFSEENADQYRVELEKMVTQHKLDMEQAAKVRAEIANMK